MLTPQLVTFDTNNGYLTTWDIFLKSDEIPDIVNQIQETCNEIKIVLYYITSNVFVCF